MDHIEKIIWKSVYGYGGILSEGIINEVKASIAKEKFYKNLSDDEYYKLIEIDPTYNKEKDIFGKYSKWILKQYIEKKFKLEDAYKVGEYLGYFDKYKHKIAEKNINKYKSPIELFNVIKPIKDAEQQGDESIMSGSGLERKIKEQETKKVYEDDQWLVVIPLTERSACYYGKGTEWCTAADKSNNMFDYYNDQGDLYININKASNRKYQFHIESGQYMDENDRPIDVKEFFDKSTEGLKNFYINKVTNNEKGFRFYDVNVLKQGDKYYMEVDNYGDFVDFFDIYSNKMGVDFIKDVLNGMGYEYFMIDHDIASDYINNTLIDMIDDENKKKISKIAGVEYERVIESLREDINSYEEIYDAINRSLRWAQESANEGKAYNMLVNDIWETFNINNVEWVGDKLRLEIDRDTFFYLTLDANIEEDYGDLIYEIKHDSPYYGYEGDLDEEYFNERLSEELYDI